MPVVCHGISPELECLRALLPLALPIAVALESSVKIGGTPTPVRKLAVERELLPGSHGSAV